MVLLAGKLPCMKNLARFEPTVVRGKSPNLTTHAAKDPIVLYCPVKSIMYTVLVSTYMFHDIYFFIIITCRSIVTIF